MEKVDSQEKEEAVHQKWEQTPGDFEKKRYGNKEVRRGEENCRKADGIGGVRESSRRNV